jgi:hypothetical protein
MRKLLFATNNLTRQPDGLSGVPMLFDIGLMSGKIVLEACRVMVSKKRPLWLHFKNADPRGASGLSVRFVNRKAAMSVLLQHLLSAHFSFTCAVCSDRLQARTLPSSSRLVTICDRTC